jgi:hypothetical protein
MWNYILTNILSPIKENLINYNGELFKNLLIAFAIILVGFLIGKLVQLIIKFILKIIYFDTICDKTRITVFLENTGIHNMPSNAVAGLFFWLIMLVSFISAVDLVSEVSSFQVLQQILSFMPSALLALFVLVFGMAIGYFLSKILRSFAVNAGATKSLSTVLEKLLFVTFIIFSAKIALNVVQINDRVILAVVDSFLKYGFLGLAIAFGLGTRMFAEDFLASFKIRSAFPKGAEIVLDGEKAIVKEIFLFHTLLYTEKGVIDLPNATLSRRIVKKVN